MCLLGSVRRGADQGILQQYLKYLGKSVTLRNRSIKHSDPRGVYHIIYHMYVVYVFGTAARSVPSSSGQRWLAWESVTRHIAAVLDECGIIASVDTTVLLLCLFSLLFAHPSNEPFGVCTAERAMFAAVMIQQRYCTGKRIAFVTYQRNRRHCSSGASTILPTYIHYISCIYHATVGLLKRRVRFEPGTWLNIFVDWLFRGFQPNTQPPGSTNPRYFLLPCWCCIIQQGNR